MGVSAILRGGLAAGFAAICAALPIMPSHAQDEAQLLANDHYSCASAMEYALTNGRRPEVHPNIAWGRMDVVLAEGAATEDAALAATRAEWKSFGYQTDPARFEPFVQRMADMCADIYRELAAQEAARPRELTVADLRAHFGSTGDARTIAEYITDRYPGGRPLTGTLAEGEYLAEMIRTIGAEGLIRLSDPAIAAMLARPYWQYDPAATKLVDGEYKRRMRVKRYSAAEAKRWAQRAQDDRQKQARQRALDLARRWGTSIECKTTQPRGLDGKAYTSCNTWKPFQR